MSEVPEGVLVRYPDGESPSMTELAERLSALIRGGLDHVVLYDGDMARVALDADLDTQRESTADHEKTGRMLYYVLRELEPDFAGLRTGELIRTVLRLPSGAVFYYLVEPGIHLYGATADLARIEALDALIAETVNSLRTDVRYSPMDYGSYASMRRAAPQPPADRSASPPPGTAAALDTAGGPRDGDTPATAVLRRALGVEGLHYLAYYPTPSAPEVADIFEQPALRNFFRGPTFEDRRSRYRRLGALLPGVMRRMNESLGAVMRGELVRVVLDVEQGAVYFHALPESRCLIGVTLDQSKVALSDDRMTRVARELGSSDQVTDVAPSP